MNEYDIGQAFAAIENELISSMIRNLKRHRVDEINEGKQWSMWQAEQLKALEEYKKNNSKKFKSKFSNLNAQIENLIRQSNITGGMEQEKTILNAIKNGFKGYSEPSETIQASFFKTNSRKLDTLIKSTTDDMEKAETAVLRMSNDQYRKIIYNAQVYANTGAGTYEKAVDMATKDFLKAGINCIQYKNGARHTMSDYASMAIRTANKRAYLQGEGTKRKEWGISTVIVNKRGNPCPKCLPFVGKIFIDDVWSGGSAKDGPYPLLSTAIESGLYHPNCKDSHTTYFPELYEKTDNTYSEKEIQHIEEENKREANKQYVLRQSEKFERLEKFSLSNQNIEIYNIKIKSWEDKTFKNVYFKSYDDLEIIKEDLRQSIQLLTEEEKQELTAYTGFGAEKLNTALATGRNIIKYQDDIRIIDSALNKGIIRNELIVNRKTIPEFMNIFPKGYKITPIDIKKTVGKIIMHPTYMSTSLVDFKYPGRNVCIKLKIPSNFRGGLYIKDVAAPKYKHQEEILLKRNLKYKITNAIIDDKIYHIEAEVIE